MSASMTSSAEQKKAEIMLSKIGIAMKEHSDDVIKAIDAIKAIVNKTDEPKEIKYYVDKIKEVLVIHNFFGSKPPSRKIVISFLNVHTMLSNTEEIIAFYEAHKGKTFKEKKHIHHALFVVDKNTKDGMNVFKMHGNVVPTDSELGYYTLFFPQMFEKFIGLFDTIKDKMIQQNVYNDSSKLEPEPDSSSDDEGSGSDKDGTGSESDDIEFGAED